MKNKQQEWIDSHPIIWKLITKIMDFTLFFYKFVICMLILTALLNLVGVVIVE